MLIAARLRQPLSTLVALYERITELGFTDHLRRIEMTLIHARDCVEYTDIGRGIRLLSELMADKEVKESQDFTSWMTMCAELIDDWQRLMVSNPGEHPSTLPIDGENSNEH